MPANIYAERLLYYYSGNYVHPKAAVQFALNGHATHEYVVSSNRGRYFYVEYPVVDVQR